MSESIQQSLFANRAAFAARGAQLEQQLNRFAGFLKAVPFQAWQWLLMFLLVLWLSQNVARLFWLVVPTPPIPPASVAVIAPATVVSSTGYSASGAVNINNLKSLTPFGSQAAVEEAPAQQAATAGVENNASDTQLSLILRGVIASNTDAAARAIISSGDRNEVYAIGDKLPVGNNVTLAKVLDLRVILNNNGNFESLWLFKEDPNAPKIASAYNEPTPAPAISPYTREGGYSQPPFQQQPQIYSRNSGIGAADQGMSDTMNKTLADVVAMSIHRENGQVVGYKIRPGRNAEMFSSLGLQTDDIVTAVNGVPLTSPGKIMEIYKNMSNATSANLEIKRGGSVINLDVVLN